MAGGVCKVIFMSNPTVVLRLGWGFDNDFGISKTEIHIAKVNYSRDQPITLHL